MSTQPHKQPLIVQGLSKAFPDRQILDEFQLTVSPGEAVGLIGENGVGKSTLLRIIVGLLSPDQGTVLAPPDLGYVGQDSPHPPGTTISDVLEAALAPLLAAISQVGSLGDRLATEPNDPQVLADYAQALEFATDHAAWDGERRTQLAAQRLGVAHLDPQRQVAHLSGGQRVRVELAALIARRPLCVVLDEPTNHLDAEAMEFVEQFLADLPGVVLVASHDRTFLDRVCTGLVDLDPSPSGPTKFTGTFSDYLRDKRARRAQWERDFGAQREELNQLRASANTTDSMIAPNRGPRDNDKFGYRFKAARVDATVRRRRRNAEQRIAALERNQIPKPPAELSFSMPPGRGAASVWVRELRVRGRLELPALDVAAGEHLLVTGANGSGKSTLLHAMAGNVTPSGGQLQSTARTPALLPQDLTWTHPERSVAALFERLAPPGAALHDFGLVHPRDHARPIGLLSTGQQRRLALAVVLARRPDLLLLDEPTNHISLALATELEEALGVAPATVIVATHDRWLTRRWSGARCELTPVP